MAKNVIVSKQGISFTKEAVETMHKWLEIYDEDNQLILHWAVAFGRKNEIIISPGSNNKTHPLAIPDQVEGIVFYWYAEKKGLEAIKPFCVDVGLKRNARLLTFPDMKPLYNE